MGLITKEVDVQIVSCTIKYYENLGYKIPREINKYGKSRFIKGAKIKVKVKDLPKGSHVKVDIECDGCGKKINNLSWRNYLKHVKDNGKYFCRECVLKSPLFIENHKKAMLKNGKSFQQWCIENNRQDILNRWDYELNNLKPSEINCNTTQKYYFKCPRNIHKSELKNARMIIYKKQVNIKCIKCNSFAQWGIDNIGEDFLEKYWDWEKNDINPWETSYSNTKVIFIKCQYKDYHESYETNSRNFVNGSRCPYCYNSHGKVHKLDSLGTLHSRVFNVWSDKNKKSPYEYTPYSRKEVYWKCPDGVHKDFRRSIDSSNSKSFRCPECQYSKGEEKINNYFILKNYIDITQEEYNKLVDKQNNKYYISQKEFDGLLGLGGGNLSYDFYLPQYNLLIEYQGEQHERYIPGFHRLKKYFEKQIEHDRRKKEYAENNNINLLEIWYWDFDRIEEILKNYINK